MSSYDMNSVVRSYPSTGHLEFPNDLYVSPEVRVTFARVSEVCEDLVAYDDTNAIAMRFVDASTGEASTSPVPVRVLVSSANDSRVIEVHPWIEGGGDYLLILGRTYRVVRGDGDDDLVFEMQAPFWRDVVHISNRRPSSYTIRIQRMLLGEE